MSRGSGLDHQPFRDAQPRQAVVLCGVDDAGVAHGEVRGSVRPSICAGSFCGMMGAVTP